MEQEFIKENTTKENTTEKRLELENLLDAAEGDLRTGYLKAAAGVVIPLATAVGLTTFYNALFDDNRVFYLSTVFTAAVFGWVIKSVYSDAMNDIKFASGIIQYSKSELGNLEKEE